jgi:hypothetical protein
MTAVAEAFALGGSLSPGDDVRADSIENRCENISRAPGDDARAAAVENLIEDLNQNPSEQLVDVPIAPAVEFPIKTPEPLEKAKTERPLRKHTRGRPTLVASRPTPVPVPSSTPPPPPPLALVSDSGSPLASDVEMVAHLALNRIKMTLERPFDPADPNYAQLLKFVCSVYGSTMNVIVRSDENRLKQRAVDRLPELLERVALEERKRDARRTIEINPGEDPGAA